ncbi:hypothetical protein EXIGLDRAFT_268190 [Exidia glandulosa HHB12029]|uniref:Uncharacterized protein n=1 Tax=Exidia glandulosa HHB12029 TaxID=1314781 RepID=A0A165DPF2_EXIGL|nr:hypothetical protein EXIGLDRAFT_268190 [Exidia glandulosa HHB12029]
MDLADQILAERRTAAALLYFFEDDDVRVENDKLRKALVDANKKLTALSGGNVAMTASDMEGKSVDFTSLRPLHPKIIRLLRDCSNRIKELHRACEALHRENRELRIRMPTTTGYTSVDGLLPDEPMSVDAPVEVEPLSSDNALVDAIAATVTAGLSQDDGSSHAEPSTPPKTLAAEPSARKQDVTIQTDESAVRSPQAQATGSSISRVSASSQTQCICLRPPLSLSIPAVAVLKTRPEPARSKEWLGLMCTSVNQSGGMPQKETWQLYRAQCGGPDSDPGKFFQALKETFPNARMAKTNDGGTQYKVLGVDRRRAPCTCASEVV